jgi:Fur family ferric uptake transcriptional regulator
VVCHRIEDVECVTGEATCLSPAAHASMPVLLSADVTFQAICAQCAELRESA